MDPNEQDVAERLGQLVVGVDEGAAVAVGLTVATGDGEGEGVVVVVQAQKSAAIKRTARMHT
jgi:hypothetical protein